ncbi:MAG TPA: tungstate ABC transporter substrate-binding protein WtpA [Gemmatimonadales bacterium]|nr:tungstate ABC transporter substrate-binding protein WtpA [Gemmatimonadales bacterium]
MMCYRVLLTLWLVLLAAGPAGAQEGASGALLVFNAGSLAKPFSDLLRAFKQKNPDLAIAQENSGSLEAARKLTELGKIPDVIGVADYGVISKLLIPEHAGWFATFARNSMVLIYTRSSEGAGEINRNNWWRILLRPGIRAGRADPALDPNGYRTLMVFQLAEQLYQRPGLAQRLQRASPSKYVRPKEADLTALVQAGELDYSWSYASIARTARLQYVDLPDEVDLSDPDRAEWYGQARVRLPGASRGGRDSVEFRGEPIVYALTIPKGAPHPRVARAFVRFIFTPEGQAILRANGFTLLERPVIGGPERPPAGLF